MQSKTFWSFYAGLRLVLLDADRYMYALYIMGWIDVQTSWNDNDRNRGINGIMEDSQRELASTRGTSDELARANGADWSLAVRAERAALTGSESP